MVVLTIAATLCINTALNTGHVITHSTLGGGGGRQSWLKQHQPCWTIVALLPVCNQPGSNMSLEAELQGCDHSEG